MDQPTTLTRADLARMLEHQLVYHAAARPGHDRGQPLLRAGVTPANGNEGLVGRHRWMPGHGAIDLCLN